jgi:hypothetical protein
MKAWKWNGSSSSRFVHFAQLDQEAWRLALPSRLPSLANAPCRFVVPSTATSRSSSRGLSRRRLRATEQQGQVQQKDADQDDTTVDSNVLPYCSIDSSKRKKNARRDGAGVPTSPTGTKLLPSSYFCLN